MSLLPVKDQMEIISRGVEEIIPEKELVSKLEENRSLTVKLGCDPSRPDLHVGHGVVLRKLRHFQDLGHHAVLVIGDFTAIIGDPSGQNKTRPQLTLEEAKSNAESYVEQAKVILDIAKLKIVYNSEWLNAMNFSDVIALASKYTVARMMERDDFTKRFESEAPISIHEFLYPLAQGCGIRRHRSEIQSAGRKGPSGKTWPKSTGDYHHTAFGRHGRSRKNVEIVRKSHCSDRFSRRYVRKNDVYSG